MSHGNIHVHPHARAPPPERPPPRAAAAPPPRPQRGRPFSSVRLRAGRRGRPSHSGRALVSPAAPPRADPTEACSPLQITTWHWHQRHRLRPPAAPPPQQHHHPKPPAPPPPPRCLGPRPAWRGPPDLVPASARAGSMRQQHRQGDSRAPRAASLHLDHAAGLASFAAPTSAAASFLTRRGEQDASNERVAHLATVTAGTPPSRGWMARASAAAG